MDVNVSLRRYFSRFELARRIYIFIRRVSYLATTRLPLTVEIRNRFLLAQIQNKFRKNPETFVWIETLLLTDVDSLREANLVENNFRHEKPIQEHLCSHRYFDPEWYRMEFQLNWMNDVESIHHFMAHISNKAFSPSPVLNSDRKTLEEAFANEGLSRLKSQVLAARFTRDVKQQPFKAPVISNPGGHSIAILIPVYNNLLWTVRCLESIYHNFPNHKVDIYVSDDCSSDDTRIRIAKDFPYVNLIPQIQNLGFLKNCNSAYAHIEKLNRYEFVYLLNNDCEVLPGWLDESIESISKDPQIGLLGSVLLYPDFSLQEAGGIIWRDGSAWNFGRQMDSRLPIYRPSRDVDYVSGAGILIRTAALNGAPLFDDRFLPAYYEDTDLAMRLRDNGWRVSLNPLSRVIHHEGKSHGVQLGSGIKSSQILNSQKFASKWKKSLNRDHFLHDPAAAVSAAYRLEAERTPRALIWMDYQIPDPSRDSGSVRTVAILEIARELGFYIIFVSANPDLLRLDGSHLARLGIPAFTSVKDALKFASLAKFQIVGVWTSRVTVFRKFMRQLKFLKKHRPIVFDTVDLHFLRLHRKKEHSLISKLATRAELKCVEIADATIVVSHFEKNLLAELMPRSRVVHISNVHDWKASPEANIRKGICFVGSFLHTPNVEGIRWFLQNVWPILPHSIQEEGLRIVGQHSEAILNTENDKNIHVLGWVPDSNEVVRSSKVSIAPLLSGAGVKGKIGEAFLCETPVVTTEIGAEGMGIISNISALVANTPEEFASSIELLFSRPDVSVTLVSNARTLLQENFSRTNAMTEMKKLFKDLQIENEN